MSRELLEGYWRHNWNDATKSDLCCEAGRSQQWQPEVTTKSQSGLGMASGGGRFRKVRRRKGLALLSDSIGEDIKRVRNCWRLWRVGVERKWGWWLGNQQLIMAQKITSYRLASLCLPFLDSKGKRFHTQMISKCVNSASQVSLESLSSSSLPAPECRPLPVLPGPLH